MNESLQNISAGNILEFSPVLQNIIYALIWFFIGLIIGHLAGKLVSKILKEFEIDKALQQKTGRKTSIEKIIVNIITYSIYFIFIIIALNQIGITSLMLNILSIVIIVVLLISMLLAIKDFIPNALAYRQITRNIPLNIIIEINSVKGEVIEITISETKVKTKEGDEIHIPNRLFLRQPHVRKKIQDTKKENQHTLA